MAVNNVITVLEQLTEAHVQLNDIAKDKRAAIMANDLDVLTKTMKAESKWIKRITELDQARIDVSIRLLEENGVKSQRNVTLHQLFGVVYNLEQRAKLSNLERQLKEQLNELRQRNELNQQLLQQSIDFVQFSIEIIVPQPDESYIYRNPAEHKPGSSKSGMYNKKV
jgi:flagellar biosynthesis/type III secretory pathway chaperone